MPKAFYFIPAVFLSLLVLASCSRPVAGFSYKGEPKVLSEIVFENTSQEAENYEWDFGDGHTSGEASPAHVYRSSGSYTVKLKAIKGKKSRMKEKELHIEAPEQCLLELETSFGNMLILLFDATPQHQDNFTKLVEEGFYDSLLFHRVIAGFMIQGGDPDSKSAKPGQALGSGGPGYTVPAEFVDSLVHIKGVLAAARTGDNVNPEKRSSGSQFYIVQGQPITDEMLDRIEAQKGFRYSKTQREAYLKMGGTPFLDRDYTVFGMVVEGLEVLDKITKTQTDGYNRPLENVKMILRLIK